MNLRELFEAPQKRTAVVAFGRMNPPTIGHQKLVEKLKSYDGDHYVFLSQSQKPKTDPLAFADKLRFAKFFFPEITIGHPNVRTPMDMMSMLQKLGYTDIIYVAGSDRVDGFTKLFNDYNGKPDKSGKIGYTFDSIEVVSAGERDPDADGAEGMSASKMRQAAADGDAESFAQGVPRPELADEMLTAVRKGMGLKDDVAAESIGAAINFPGYEKDDENKKEKKKKKSKGLLAKLKSIVGIDESLFEAAAKTDADAMIAAIKAFQTAAGLKADGIVGPNTRAKAAEMMKDPAQAQAVTSLQAAIKDFQTKAGIAVDGKVGPETMSAVKQAQSGGGAAPAADPNANAGVDGPADATANAAQGGDATTPAQKPQTADQAQQTAGQQQTDDPNAQKAQPEDPNTTTPVNNKNNQQPPEQQGTDGAADQQQGNTEQPAQEKPAAEPKVSAEKYMQMNDQGPGLANFNVQKMKAKYPEPYLDIPNDDGTVTRAYGPTKNLQAFIDTDSRGKGLKLSGGTAAPAAPAQDTQAPQDDQKQTDQQQGDAQQTDQQQGDQQQGDAQQTDQQQGDQEKDDTQQTDQQQTDKTAQDDQQQTDQTPPNDDPKGFDAASDVTDDDLNAPNEPGDKPARKPKSGKETYTVNGKEMSRNDVAKRLNALLRKARGTAEGIDFKSPLARLLTEALSDAEKKELQALIDAVKDSRYFATFINKPNTLKALQDAGIQNIPGKPEKRKRTGKVDRNKKTRKYYKTDPETGKEVEIDKDEADAMQAKFDKATMTKRDADGKDDFDRKLDGDDDIDSTMQKSKDKIAAMKKGGANVKTTSSSTSTSTSNVTTTGGQSTTTKSSGGGSTTRFSKVMRATDETKKLRAEKKEVRKKMSDFAKQWEKDNPDGDTFGAMDTPEYKKLRDEYDSYRGMDGKVAKSKEMVHPSGTMDSEGNIKYNTKDGKWDGEQYDPKRKNDLKDSIDLDRIKMLAGV